MHHIAEAAGLGIDPSALTRWMDLKGLGSGPLTSLARIGGGTQNIVVDVRRGDVSYVLRRPPLKGRPDGSQTMLREAAVLDGLSKSGVPHPPLVATCRDESVIGASFYLMSPVDGFNPASALPDRYRRDAGFQKALGFAMVDALIALVDVDVTQPPLSTLGSTDGWLERQVPRWTRRLGALDAINGYEPLPPDRVAAVVDWLDDHRPLRQLTGLVHGDYSLANVIVAEDSPRVNAIVDWELAAPGDPRLDMGHFLTSLGIEPVPGLMDAQHLIGIPPCEELADYYVDRVDTNHADLQWFQVFSCLRLLVLLEETVGRSAAGHASAKLAAAFRGVTTGLLKQAEGNITNGRHVDSEPRRADQGRRQTAQEGSHVQL